ncbi:Cytochrome P450 3A28 [Smittium culicis]|uniref:Cytochrome P450 3A28 n=1 Tax=Smittium culicis TaxID=133412 RepID=A0A1R1XX24_9FUNG|nr:Cytochrome P450 3A28 [Smittium culicis]
MIESGETKFNYWTMFQRTTADVISKICFGRSFETLKDDNSPFIECFRSTLILASVTSAVPAIIHVPVLLDNLKKNTKIMFDFVHESIEIRKKSIIMDKSNEGIMDVLQMFLNSNNPDGKKLSEKEVFSETFLMLTAGTDATAMTLTSVLHMLTLYPQVYNKVVEEVRNSFPDREKIIKFNEAKEKLPYLTAVVYESMRLIPIAGGLVFRQSSNEGIEISGLKIPKNTKMGLFLEGANRDPKLYENPLSFMPERYLGPNGDALKKETFSFSHGVRICPGRKYDLLTIYI